MVWANGRSSRLDTTVKMDPQVLNDAGIKMASDELRKSWKRTEAFLLDARSHFSEAAEAVCADEIRQFEEYLRYNELELALDLLEAAFDKSGAETYRVLELMALAAASMRLFDLQRRYDEQLSKARGWKHETILPT